MAEAAVVKMFDSNLIGVADDYGQVKAKMAKLTKRQKTLKGIMEEAGIHELEGDLFRCVGSEVPTSLGVDWEKIARKLGASKKMIEHPSNKCVTKKAHFRVSVYGLTGEES